MEQFVSSKKNPYFLIWFLVFIGLYLTSLYHYPLFHSLAEIFSVVIACGIFMIVWNSRRFLDNNYLLFIGIAYLFIGGLDLIHTLAYKGMGVFHGYETNLPTQLWIAARYMEGLSFLLAPFFFRQKLKANSLFLGYALATFLLLTSIFYWNIFPVCFVDGVGLTPFKKISEYIISLMLLISIVLLIQNGREFEREVLRWVVWSIILTIVSELAFTFYIDAFGLSNLIGHIFKILSFYFIYKAIIQTGFSRPYNLLFRNLKQSEISLQEEKNKIQNYLDIAGVILVVIDVNQRVSLINKKGCQVLGVEEKEIIGKNWFDTFIPERIREKVKTSFWKLMNEEMDIAEYFENPVLTKDGRERIIAWHSSVLRNERGEIISTLSSGEDISERKQMEEKLRRSRDELERRVQERTKELRNVVETLIDEMVERKQVEEDLREQSRILGAFFTSTITPLVFLDRDFNFIRVNDAYAKACQREISEFPGHNHFEFYPHEENESIFRRVVEAKTPYQAIAKPFSFPDHPEWETTYWDWTLTPLLDDNGEVEYLFFALEDVSERRRAEEELRAASLYTRSLVEASLDPLVTISKDGKIMDVNRATELVTGLSRDKLIGSDFSDYFTEPEKARVGYQQVFEMGSVRDYTLAIRHTSGLVTDVLYNATIYRNEAGEVQGVFAAARDITERKQAENRIQATNALLSLFSKKSVRKEYLEAVVDLIQSWTGCRCVGIRVLDKQGFIPYESYVGFSQEFWKSENMLSVSRDQCACIRIATGNPGPQDVSMMTPGGSFHCDNTLKFLGQLSGEEKARFRGACLQNGFLSVSIVPIRYHGEVLGAIHLADKKEGQVPFKAMELIESVAPFIAEAFNRFNLEEEIQESENRLRILSSQLLAVQENERKRVAREIHDGIGQMLSAIKFKVEDIAQQKRKGTVKIIGETLEAVIPLIQESIEEVRRIQMDLRPSTLDDLGISATIGWFYREFQKIYSSIRAEYQIDIQEIEVPTELKTVIFRVTQEAMNNVSKHSKADSVHLSLKKKDNRIELVIEDNGIGFDLENSRKGYGLGSMRERTDLSGGSFVIESTQGVGTVIKATWLL